MSDRAKACPWWAIIGLTQWRRETSMIRKLLAWVRGWDWLQEWQYIWQVGDADPPIQHTRNGRKWRVQ